MKKIISTLSLLLICSATANASAISDDLAKNYVQYCINNGFDKNKIENFAKTNNLKSLPKATPEGSFIYFINDITMGYIHGECMLSEDNVNFNEVRDSLESQMKSNDIHYKAVSPNAQYILFMPTQHPSAVFITTNKDGRIVIDGKNIVNLPIPGIP